MGKESFRPFLCRGCWINCLCKIKTEKNFEKRRNFSSFQRIHEFFRKIILMEIAPNVISVQFIICSDPTTLQFQFYLKKRHAVVDFSFMSSDTARDWKMQMAYRWEFSQLSLLTIQLSFSTRSFIIDRMHSLNVDWDITWHVMIGELIGVF